MIDWKGVCIHHSATPDGTTLSWPAIERYHVENRGWVAIGYHFGVEIFDRGVQVLVGRPLYRTGAHAQGFNDRLIGVCVVGNFDLAPPRADVTSKTVDLVATLALLFDWQDIRGVIFPHSEVANKTCPGLRFGMNEFRSLVYARVTRLRSAASTSTCSVKVMGLLPSSVRPL